MRAWGIMLTSFFTLFFVACGVGGSQEHYIANFKIAEEHYAATYADYNEEETLQEQYTQQELFLQDLDYMLYVLENNFALFDVAYWAHGTDIHAIGNTARDSVQNNPDMDMTEFFATLNYDFGSLISIGHFALRLPQPYRPTVGLSPGERASNFIRQHGGNERIQFQIDRISLFNENELAAEMSQALLDKDFEKLEYLLSLAFEIIDSSPNVSTDIIEEDRIAYLSINSINPSAGEWRYSEEIVFDFYEQIRGYEHLIIDMRRTTGGHTFHFYNTILRPNIDSTVSVHGFAFVMGGERSARILSRASDSVFCDGCLLFPTDGVLHSIPEMFNEFELPELNKADMERMDYGFLIQTNHLSPSRRLRFDFATAFDGKIWLLTSPLMGSAAQVSAWVSMESGFATHVGEVTGGNFGGPREWIALPYSGIEFQMDFFYVTDERGRPLEAGTIPHHFNRPDMDALETTLALIAEGEY